MCVCVFQYMRDPSVRPRLRTTTLEKMKSQLERVTRRWSPAGEMGKQPREKQEVLSFQEKGKMKIRKSIFCKKPGKDLSLRKN